MKLRVKVTESIIQATRKEPPKNLGNVYLCFLSKDNVVKSKTLASVSKLAKEFGFDGISFIN